MILKKPLLEYFPEGFTPRPHQIKGFNAIDAALREGKKFIIIDTLYSDLFLPIVSPGASTRVWR